MRFQQRIASFVVLGTIRGVKHLVDSPSEVSQVVVNTNTLG